MYSFIVVCIQQKSSGMRIHNLSSIIHPFQPHRPAIEIIQLEITCTENYSQFQIGQYPKFVFYFEWKWEKSRKKRQPIGEYIEINIWTVPLNCDCTKFYVEWKQITFVCKYHHAIRNASEGRRDRNGETEVLWLAISWLTIQNDTINVK